MKVFYSHDIFSEQRYGGVSRYFIEVIERLSKQDLNIEVISGLFFNEYLKNLNKQTKKIKISGRPIQENILANKFGLRILNEVYQNHKLSNESGSILHQTYYSPFPIKKNLKVVATVHDMAHEIFPEMFHKLNTTSLSKKKSCIRADKIIAVSQSTKRDLISLFDIDPLKIEVIYHGSNFAHKFTSTSPHKHLRPYLLFVGMRGGYKNFKRMLNAYSQSDKIKKEFDLVCFGGGKFNKNELKNITEHKLNDRVLHIAGNDETLAQYYRGARALIYPSLYEGFGIPILEAMSLDCPIFCSNKSSLPEVALDAAAYFEPDQAESIKEKLEEIIFNDSILKELSNKGLIRSQFFDWSKAAELTYQLYTKL